MTLQAVKVILKRLTQHREVAIVSRGNSAITFALSIIPKGKIILIPEEGGWIHYYKAPQRLKLKTIQIHCDDACINPIDLQEKLQAHHPTAILYQNPGGYFAQQPIKVIYELCKQHDCMVIMDVSGALGTELSDGNYADILVGSLRKIVDAEGGFISCKDKALFEKIESHLEFLEDRPKLELITQKLQQLPERISTLTRRRKKILHDLKELDIVYPQDFGFVVVIKFSTLVEKEEILRYCQKEKLEWVECPRYIRLNKPAISIEVKRL